jgi:hypothetical protein
MKFRILLPGNNRVGYVDAYTLDGLKAEDNYALIGCLDEQRRIAGIYISPQLKPDKTLFEILQSHESEMEIVLTITPEEPRGDVTVEIFKKTELRPKASITFDATAASVHEFIKLIKATDQCWFIWRGEGFFFFADFDPTTGEVASRDLEFLQ